MTDQLTFLFIHIYDHKITKYSDLVRSLVTEYLNNNIREGYLYCLHNEMFKFYGDNFYKLGVTSNPVQRLKSYATGYLKKSEYKIISKKIIHSDIAESLLFKLLENNRMSQQREFFNCDINIIKDNINSVEQIMSNNNIFDIVKQYNLSCERLQKCIREFNKLIEEKHDFLQTLITFEKNDKTYLIKTINNTKTNEYKINELKEILESPLITNEENDKLTFKQKINMLTKLETCKKNHFYLDKTFHINKDTLENNEDNLNKLVEFIYKNNNLVEQIKQWQFKFNPSNFFINNQIPILEAEQIEKIKLIDSYIKKIGFKHLFDTNILNSDDVKNFVLNVDEVKHIQNIFGHGNFARFNSDFSTHKCINYISRLCQNMYGLQIKSKEFKKRIKTERLLLYQYSLSFDDNPILDYIVIKCSKYKHSELFESFKQFIKNNKFKFSFIHGINGTFDSYVERITNEYLFLEDQSNETPNVNMFIDS